MPFDRPLHSNAEWFARIVVTVGLMEIGLRIRWSFFPRLALTSPLIFCDWWKSWMVDNFAFNKRQSSISKRYRLMGEKRVLRLLWPVTSYYVRILYAELNAEFCLCIFKELQPRGKCMYVYMYVRVRVCGCVAISVPISPVRREDWTGQHAKFREVIFARGIPHPYWCILRRLKAGSIEKAAYCFMRALQRDFRFLCLRRRRWSSTSNCAKGRGRIF